MRIAVFISAFLFLTLTASAQDTPSIIKTNPASQKAALASSAAYAEVVLRKTELAADLESMMIDYTDEHPKVVDTRIEIDLLQKELDRLATVKAADSGKLTSALGKMIVRKASLGVDLAALRLKYDDKHPEVITAKKKVDVFEKAIKDILSP